MITCMFVCLYTFRYESVFPEFRIKCMKSQETESSEHNCYQAPCKNVLINEIFILFTPYYNALQPKL